jgi:hypothetical protein
MQHDHRYIVGDLRGIAFSTAVVLALMAILSFVVR